MLSIPTATLIAKLAQCIATCLLNVLTTPLTLLDPPGFLFAYQRHHWYTCSHAQASTWVASVLNSLLSAKSRRPSCNPVVISRLCTSTLQSCELIALRLRGSRSRVS
ncbi:uncharacterized protein EDB91DRAFT_1120688 [Suillus paluster]|uniref:uncharacterized protein n=1 Tax=Suillus paluster TaxID=48578 RepID=UPI001B85BB3B|nr:uncharacterized protein EDB91DRAFT_1120688 [Suillus paluster]KAG1745398.1 hypothetical protein EDB91DRAFT_1120688 [Suillus paluster]